VVFVEKGFTGKMAALRWRRKAGATDSKGEKRKTKNQNRNSSGGQLRARL